MPPQEGQKNTFTGEPLVAPYYGTKTDGTPMTKAEIAAGGEWGLGAGALGGFGEISFESIEALAPIDVEGIVADIGRINRGEFDINLGQARSGARAMTQEVFGDFNTFVDTLLPGAKDMIAATSRETLNFINKGMPSAAQNNAILRDAGAAAAGGLAGDIAMRRSLYNEAQRDTAAVQYGMGQAQQMVQAAQNVGMQFASMQANATNAFLGQLNSLTMISPAQGVAFAFDERKYQTGVDQFNATGNFNESSANAQMGFQYAQLAQQNAQFQQKMALAEKQRKEAEKASQYGAIGTVIGAGLGSLIPGVGTAIGIGIGAQIGGGIGAAAGGNYTGATQGLIGGIGTYAGYQTGLDQMAQQRAQLEQSRRYMESSLEMQRAQMSAMYPGSISGGQQYYPGISSAPWAPASPGPAMQGFGNYSGAQSGSNFFPYR